MTRSPVIHLPRLQRQRGATLFIALMMLAVIALMGASGATLLQLDEQAARNYRARDQAWMSAQAGLDDAIASLSRRLDTLGPEPDRQAMEAMFPDDIGCDSRASREDARGFCRGTPTRLAWDDGQGQAMATAAVYGQTSGARFSSSGSASPPRYFIELLEPSSKNAPDDATPPLFRLTAIGFGPQSAQVRLQAVFRWRPSNDSTHRQSPLQQIAWREFPFSY